jgi:HD-like signal output (HDOD) protein
MTEPSQARGVSTGGGPARVKLDGPDLDDLELRVRAYFDQHQPEPASFPAIASQVIDLVEHPNVDIARLAHVIEREPAICTAVLAVANSAAHRRADPVQNVRVATNLLGLKRVANVAAGVACRSLFDVEERVEHDLFPNWYKSLFHASMTDAFAASFAAMRHHDNVSEGIFLAAMLHDLGKLLSLRSLAALALSGELAGVPDDDTIEELLARTRAPIGAAALARFNMPSELVELCAHQDDAHLTSSAGLADAYLIRLVSSLNALRMTTLNTSRPIALLLDAVQSMKLREAEVVEMAGEVSEQASNVSLLFSISDDADDTGYIEFVRRCLETPAEPRCEC